MSAGPMVPLAFIERLERAQLEILAIQLFAMENGSFVVSSVWQKTLPAIREKYRAQAHEIMQGAEPASWNH